MTDRGVLAIVGVYFLALCLIANFMMWAIDRNEPTMFGGCGGCTYVQYLKQEGRKIDDLWKHLW
jgi:hypothetical protein